VLKPRVPVSSGWLLLGVTAWAGGQARLWGSEEDGASWAEAPHLSLHWPHHTPCFQNAHSEQPPGCILSFELHPRQILTAVRQRKWRLCKATLFLSPFHLDRSQGQIEEHRFSCAG
jgi:hypothetical protein